MVRLKGPAASEAASGALATVLSFAKSKRGTYAKAHAAPAQPNTGAQVSVRVMVKFLSQWWKTFSPTEQDSWSDLAAAADVAGYHVFIRNNMLRWKNFRSPTKEYPAAEILLPTQGTRPQAAAGVASINVGVQLHVATNNQGALLFRGPTTGFSADLDRVVQVIPKIPLITWAWWLDTPLEPGTYWYCDRKFTVDGNLAAVSGYRSATVT